MVLVARQKHIDVQMLYVQDIVNNREVKILSKSTGENTADLGTKHLARPRMDKLRAMLGVIFVSQGEAAEVAVRVADGGATEVALRMDTGGVSWTDLIVLVVMIFLVVFLAGWKVFDLVRAAVCCCRHHISRSTSNELVIHFTDGGECFHLTVHGQRCKKLQGSKLVHERRLCKICLAQLKKKVR